MAPPCNASADDQFGPSVSCPQFDFTLKFEQSTLSIGVSSILLILFPLRVIWLNGIRIRGLWNRVYYLKIGIATFLFGVQIASLVLWCRDPITTTSIPSATIALLGSVAVLILVAFDHNRTIRPSTLTSVYLLASIVADAVQARTLYLRNYVPVIGALLLVGLANKVLLLVLESWPKPYQKLADAAVYGPEETSGIFGRSLFWWLNPLLLRGNSFVLTTADLFSLDRSMDASTLQEKIMSFWEIGQSKDIWNLMLALSSCLRWEILAIVIPRLAAIAFNYTQPFLISEAIQYLEEPAELRNANHKYGLIGATALIYLGIAISTAIYNQKTYRMVTAFRGSMVSLIYAKTLTIKGTSSELAPVTLMSTDVDRVAVSLQLVNEIWARIVEIGIGIWLLWRQLGAISVAPILIVLVCFGVEMWIARYMGPRQAVWVEAVQKRVGIVSSVLRSMKSVKMSGLADILGGQLQTARLRELDQAKRFRWLLVWLNVVSSIPQLLSGLVVFAVFSVQEKEKSRPLSSSRAFTSLAIISLLTSPAALLLGSLPMVAAASGCLYRIHEYLISDTRNDTRNIDATIQKEKSLQTTDTKPAIEVSEIMLSYSKDTNPVSLVALARSVTMIFGPVGSGKSTLLKVILGEVDLGSSKVFVSAAEIAYCAQTPWLPNASLRTCILGNRKYEESWYSLIIEICDLGQDFLEMPRHDQTLCGSRGVRLSGGQKHRIALARALYSRCSILLLDDFLSGLDNKTRRTIMEKLCGQAGFCKRHNVTLVLATHDTKYRSFADHLLVLDTKGVEYSGPPQYWNPEPHHGNDFSKQSEDAGASISPRTSNGQSNPNGPKNQTKEKDYEAERRNGEFSTWKYYAMSIGARRVVLALAFITVNVISSNFPKLWLKWNMDDKSESSGRFIGVYAMFVAVTYISQGALIWQVMISIVPKSGAYLHKVLVDTVINASMSFLDSTDSNIILNRFSQDMTLVDGALPSVAFGIFMSLAQCIMQAALISLGSTYMAITIPVGVCVVYCIQKYYLRTSRQIRLLDLEAKSPLYQHFVESLEGLITIRAYCWQSQFNTVALRLLDCSQRPYYLLYCIQRWLNLVMDLFVAVLAILLVALALSINRSDGGSLGVALTSILAFNQTLQSLITGWTQAETSLGAVLRTKTFEQSTPLEADPPDPYLPQGAWPSGKIEFSDATMVYADGTVALQNFSLTINPGQKIGICGRTGSGKSSVLAVLLRLADLETGTISIDGVDITEIPRELVRQRLICLPQDPLIFAGSFRFNLDPESRIETDATINDALQKVGLLGLVNNRGGLGADFEPDTLSYGEQQLLALARAIIRHQLNGGRCILLLDEATSNMDSTTESFIINTISKEFIGNTIIVVAHGLESIQDADQLVGLESGRIKSSRNCNEAF